MVAKVGKWSGRLHTKPEKPTARAAAPGAGKFGRPAPMHANSAAALAGLDTARTVPVAPQPFERCRLCGSALQPVERHNAPGDYSSTISLVCSRCCVTGAPFEAPTTCDTKLKRHKPPALHPHPTVPAPASPVLVALAHKGPGASFHRMTSAILTAIVRVRDWCAISDSVGRADVNLLAIVVAEHLVRPWLDHPVHCRHYASSAASSAHQALSKNARELPEVLTCTYWGAFGGSVPSIDWESATPRAVDGMSVVYRPICVFGWSLFGAQIPVGSSEWMVLVDLSQEDVNRLGARFIGSEFKRYMYYGAVAALELLVGFGYPAEELRSGQNLIIDLFHVITDRSNIVELFVTPVFATSDVAGYFAPWPAMTSSFGALGSAAALVLLADRIGSLAGHTMVANPPFCPGRMAVVQRLVAHWPPSAPPSS